MATHATDAAAAAAALNIDNKAISVSKLCARTKHIESCRRLRHMEVSDLYAKCFANSGEEEEEGGARREGKTGTKTPNGCAWQDNGSRTPNT